MCVANSAVLFYMMYTMMYTSDIYVKMSHLVHRSLMISVAIQQFYVRRVQVNMRN